MAYKLLVLFIKMVNNYKIKVNLFSVKVAIKDHLLLKDTAKEFSNGKMDQYMMVNGMKIIYKGMEHAPGLMKESIKENGRIIVCMELVTICWLMVNVTLVNIKKIENMVLEFLNFQIINYILVTGKMVKDMVWVQL